MEPAELIGDALGLAALDGRLSEPRLTQSPQTSLSRGDKGGILSVNGRKIHQGDPSVIPQIEEQHPIAEKHFAEAQQQLRTALAMLQHSQEELARAQMRLIQAERLESVGKLAAGIAHEVKNPLAVVLMGIEYLARALKDADESSEQVLRSMREAVRRADSILRGLMNYCAPTELEKKPCDLNPLVIQSLQFVRHELLASHLVTVLELAPDLPPLQIDGPKINQVFVNVLTNAAQAMSAGGTLTIRTWLASTATDEEAEKGAVVIEVDDTGPGIPQGVIDHVFDPFFTTKPAEKGNGLGLSVARQIVDIHQGTMHIQNLSDRGGVRVRISLPLATPN